MSFIVNATSLLIVLTAALPLIAENAGSKVTPLEIPFLEKAPTIDGQLDDPAWEGAATIPEFRLYSSGGTPKKNTSVRLGYDSQYLYLAFECFTPKGNSVAIVNQESVDAPVFNDDCVEVFFTAGDQTPVFHIAASARGIRWDAVDEKPELWDGRWKVATGRTAEAWTAEFRIPFQDLPQAGHPQGTPPVEATGWMNLAREEKERSEWTQWSPSKQGFAERACFRPVKFGARPEPWDAEVRIASQGLLSVGSSALVVEAGNLQVQPVEFTCSLARKTAEGWKSKIILLQRPQCEGGQVKLSIPYQISQGGAYRILLETKSPKARAPLHVWSAAFEVVDLSRPIAILSDKINHIQKLVTRLKDATVRKNGETAQKKIEKDLASIQRGTKDEKGLTAAVWADLQKKAGETVGAADRLERQLQRQAWKEDLASKCPGADFCVGMTTPFEQVFREDLFAGPINQALKLQCARNEMEDGQIVLIPLADQDLSEMAVEISDLKAEKGGAVLEAKQWWIGAVGYIERPRPANAGEDFRVFWPDVLLPAGPIKMEAGKQQPVFLRVTVPSDQAAGLYRGSLTVRSKASTQTVPVELEVWDFALPKAASLQSDTWLNFQAIYQYYGIKEGISLEQFERILRDFQGYRLSLYPYEYYVLGPKLKLFREKDGSFTVDFTDFDPFIDLAIKYGATAINLNLGCSGGMQTLFAGGFGFPYLKITDRVTGKVSPYPEKCHWPAPEMYENPDFIAFWKAYWQHAKDKGWDQVAYVEDVDEPGSSERKEWLLHTHAFFRKHCPGLPLLSFGTIPSLFKKAVGLIDWWAPVLRVYGEDAAFYRERQKNFGERLWIYTCGDAGKNSRGYTPDTYIYTPLLDKRIVPLMCWKFNVQGVLHFTFNGFRSHPDLEKKGTEKKWGQYPILHAIATEAQFGQANLTWPGPEICQLLPSLRLEMIRDGREDYEYLALLGGLLERLKKGNASRHRALIEETARQLQVPDELVEDAYVWCHDPKMLLDWRSRMAEQILKLQKALAPK